MLPRYSTLHLLYRGSTARTGFSLRYAALAVASAINEVSLAMDKESKGNDCSCENVSLRVQMMNSCAEMAVLVGIFLADVNSARVVVVG